MAKILPIDGPEKRTVSLGAGTRAWVRCSRDVHGGNKMGLMVSLEQPLPLPRLTQVLRILERRHPVLRSHLVRWTHLEEQPEAPDPSVCVTPVTCYPGETAQAVWRRVQLLPVRCGASAFSVFVMNGSDPTKSESNPTKTESNPTKTESDPTKTESDPTKTESNPTTLHGPKSTMHASNPTKTESNPTLNPTKTESNPTKHASNPTTVFVASGPNPTTDLLCCMEHFAGDGQSLACLVDELLRGMVDPNDPTLSVPKAWFPDPAHASANELPKHCRVAGSIKSLCRSAGCVFRPKHPRAKTCCTTRGLDTPTPWFSCNMRAERLTQLKQQARARGVKLNAVLEVAAYLAFMQAGGHPVPGRVSLDAVVNLRVFYKRTTMDRGDLGMHVGQVTTSFATHTDLWQSVINYNSALEHNTYNGDSMLWFKMTEHIILSLLPFGPCVSPPYLFSNWGRLPIRPEYGAGVGKVLDVTPILHTNYVSCPYICFSSFNGRLGVGVMGSGRLFDNNSVRELALGVREIINRMINE